MRIPVERTVLLISLFIILASFPGVLLSPDLHAAEREAMKVTIVSGVIQNVSGDDIIVNDRRYTIPAGVPILKISGQPASRDELKIGNVADIYIRDRIIFKVLVHVPLPT